MLDPTGRVVLISGANRGFGLALAQTLHARGYCLSLGARDVTSLATPTATMDAARLHTARYDATDWASHDAWVDGAVACFGRIDVLINNAAIDSPMTLRTPNEAALDEVWAVNCKAPLHMTSLALPHLEASGAGRVINVSSLSGKRVATDHVGYSMSKFAVMALTHSTRRIAWHRDVRATAVCPGWLRTDMTADETEYTPEQMLDPCDLAELVATIIALPNSASVPELLVNHARFEATA